MLATEAAVTAANLTFAALFLGALATAGLLLPTEEPLSLRRDLVRIALTSILFFLIAGFCFLCIQGIKLEGGKFPSLSTLERYISATQSGSVWLTREAYGALLLLGTLRLLRQGSASGAVTTMALFSLPLVASRSLMSHAMAVKENTALMVAIDALHLVATALWAGALPFLFWVLLRSPKPADRPLALAAHAVRRFSWLAFFSFVVIGSTGFFQSWTHVGEPSALFASAYGRVLLLKLAIVSAMAVLGAWNFFSTRRDLIKATTLQPAFSKGLRKIGAESVLGLLVLCVTGFLTVLPPAAHTAHKSSPAMTGAHATHNIDKLLPAEGASVRILSPKSGQIFKGDQIPISFKFVKGKRAEHVHAYVDGELMGMFTGQKGTLTGIQPGHHTLELRVATRDHQSELDAVDRVDFLVK
jgi:putative copper export protein